jgi:hypothetical protein
VASFGRSRAAWERIAAISAGASRVGSSFATAFQTESRSRKGWSGSPGEPVAR